MQAITQSHYHVLEIGVHNGFHAAMFTSLLDPDLGIYHGIELMPNCYLSALAQLKLNNAGNNFHLMQAAAGDKTGIVSYADIDSGNGSVVNSGGIPVSQITGDSLLPYFNGRIELLKIDVEGYEAFVLEGCSEILAQKPNVAIELHFSAWPGFKTTLEQVFKKINLEDYHGVFFCNPNSGELYGLEDPERIRPFNLTDLKKSDNMNVFLFSKKYFRRLPDEF
ncbi:MAG: FkbM family methyltransferase [Bacteroidota bacterium]